MELRKRELECRPPTSSGTAFLNANWRRKCAQIPLPEWDVFIERTESSDYGIGTESSGRHDHSLGD